MTLNSWPSVFHHDKSVRFWLDISRYCKFMKIYGKIKLNVDFFLSVITKEQHAPQNSNYVARPA